MSKVKKVSIRAIEEASDDKSKNAVSIDFNGLEITVKRMLHFYDMMRFVRDVVSGCFAEDTGRYMPEILPFMMRLCVIAYYTNVNIPQSVEKQYDFVYSTGLYEAIIEHIDRTQFDDIEYSIRQSISHAADANINAIHTQFVSIQDGLNSLVSQIKDTFGEIDTGDIENIISAITENGIDEGRLMRAYINSKKHEE